MKRYTTEFLIKKLRQKAIELRRTPKKEEIDADKTMPNSSTYLMRFGSLTNAFKIIDLPINKNQEVSLGYFIKLAIEFYNKHGRAPTIEDFDKTPGFPHSSYIRKEMGMTWNKFLTMAGLPIMENGEVWVKHFSAEKYIEELLKETGIAYVFQSVLNINAPHAFTLKNGITLDVRFSSPILSAGSYFWKFKTHLKTKKKAPDYFVCIGYDNAGCPDTMFLIPTGYLSEKQQVVSVNTKRVSRSKYGKFVVQDLESLKCKKDE